MSTPWINHISSRYAVSLQDTHTACVYFEIWLCFFSKSKNVLELSNSFHLQITINTKWQLLTKTQITVCCFFQQKIFVMLSIQFSNSVMLKQIYASGYLNSVQSENSFGSVNPFPFVKQKIILRSIKYIIIDLSKMTIMLKKISIF